MYYVCDYIHLLCLDRCVLYKEGDITIVDTFIDGYIDIALIAATMVVLRGARMYHCCCLCLPTPSARAGD